MKLAVIGGGSTYTPELADGIGRLLPGLDELVLVDPDADRLAAVGPVSARIMAAHGHPARVRWTASLDDGADGADAILFQLRIGGQAARQRDETWPLDCGCVGQETTGAGGFAKALRTVPIVLDLAERAVRRASPSAFIIDFTNPVGIVTRALLSAVPDPMAPLSQVTDHGEPPKVVDPAPGCRFRWRCPLAIDECSTVTPALAELGTGHQVACHVAQTGAEVRAFAS